MADISANDIVPLFSEDDFKVIFQKITATYSRMLGSMETEAD
jgi:hypothetical protein